MKNGITQLSNGRITIRLSCFLGSTSRLLEVITGLEIPPNKMLSANTSHHCRSKHELFRVQAEGNNTDLYSDLELTISPIYRYYPPNDNRNQRNLRKELELETAKRVAYNKKRRERYQLKKQQENAERQAILDSLSDKVKATLFE